DHVLSAPSPRLGAPPARRPARPRGAIGPARRLRAGVRDPDRRAGRGARVTDLAALADELFPSAWRTRAGKPGGTVPEGRGIAWVRVMRGRVPAFDALEPGDLVLVPASALAVVAPGVAELEALVVALAATPVSGALLVDGDGEAGGSGALDRAV